MVTKSFKTRLDESVQDASLLGLGLGFALVYYFSKGGGGRVFGGSRDFGDRAWIEGCCCVCTNSFEGLYFRGWGTVGGLWCVSVCRKCKQRAAPGDGSHDCASPAAPASAQYSPSLHSSGSFRVGKEKHRKNCEYCPVSQLIVR